MQIFAVLATVHWPPFAFQLAVTAAVETPCRLYILAITGPRTALLWHSETFPVTGLVSCDLYRCTLHCRGLSLTLKFSGIYNESSKLYWLIISWWLTRGADNSRPDYTAPSCPTEQLSYSFISRVDFCTLSEGGGPLQKCTKVYSILL